MFKPNIVNKSQGIVSGSSYFVHIQMNIKAMDVTMRSVALPSNNTKGPIIRAISGSTGERWDRSFNMQDSAVVEELGKP